MNKKIKIIDLVIKLRNPIEMPKRVKYKDTIYIYDKQRNNYYYCDHEIYISECLKDILNDEVEIIEDNTEEIEELEKEMKATENPYNHIQEISFYYDANKMGDKINELVKKVNSINKKNK